jgi:cell division protein FtsW (lipid II flippase)
VRASTSAQASDTNIIQNRLMVVAVVFVIFYAASLTLSPAVRLHTLDTPLRWMHWLGVAAWLASFLFIHRQLARRLPEHDPYLLPAAAMLTGWGLLTIWRLDETFGERQTLWLALTSILVGWLLRFPSVLVFLRRYKYLWLVCGLLLTAITFIFGTYPGGIGPKEWLGCCGVYLQPSEPLKLLLIVYLAAYMADRLPLHFKLFELLAPSAVLTGAALVILIGQRDLGSASLFIGLYAIMIYIASGKRRLLVASGILILVGGFIGYRLFDVIRLRVDAWLNPWIDASGRAYQIVQSLIAVASGGIFGSGIGLGSPGVVPVSQSDFIFSAITEEMGLIGSLGIILILVLLAERGLVLALRAANHYQRYLASGLTFYLVGQSILIIGGNIRLLPLTGVTLPFVSYGGSSLLTSMISLLLLLMISSHRQEQTIISKEVRPVLVSGAILGAGLAALGLAAGYWGFIRSDDLQARADNPRWSIDQRYVVRGQILDHNNQPIALTVGQPGDYTRQVVDPYLGPIIGYTHPIYGQAGLEASLDPYLRGLQGYPASTNILDKLFYAQNPPGLDVRLSLDLNLQQKVDALLQGHSGAVVVLNARSGEILAMASQPAFDPNQLDQNWQSWVNDPRSLFLNRATQGQYPIGTGLGPFLLATSLALGPLQSVPSVTSIPFNGTTWNCAVPPNVNAGWGDMISSGCPGAIVDLYRALPAERVIQLYSALGFQTQPQLPLPVAQAPTVNLTDAYSAALGQSPLSVSPLQMALAAAVLSNNGVRPTPRITDAIHIPQNGWDILPSAPVSSSFLNQSTPAASLLQMNDLPAWQTTATAFTAKGKVTWYLSGTIPGWQGAPLAMALLLEEDNPALAQNIGSTVMKSLVHP